MAFNPFSNFRKYRAFWMATILLMSMITFVLCTGAGQGDLSDIMLKIFRSRGTAWAKLDGDNIYSGDFHDLKDRRNVANEFMRTVGKICMSRMDEVLNPENIKKVGDNPKQIETLRQAQGLRNYVHARVTAPRFFEGGVKVDELIDFKIWLAEADRIGIELNNDAVMSLVPIELVRGNREFYAADVYNLAKNEIRRNNQKANDTYVMQCLRDEFRVRLAQAVLGYGFPNYVTPRITRAALTPGQIWENYREKRVEYKLSLLPLHVEDFVRDLKTPDDETLKIFFDQYKAQAFEPTSEKPGLAIPNRVKVAWISGDANSDYFKKLSKLALDLQTTPPLPFPPGAGWQVVGAQLAKPGAAHLFFENLRGRYMTVGPMEHGANLSIAAYVSQKDPFTAGAIIGAGARLDAGIATLPSFLSMGILRHAKEFEAGVQADMKKRAPFYASLPLLGTAHQGLAIPFVWDNFRLQTDYLPLSVIQDELLEFVQRNQARLWVQNHMQAVKKDLEKIPVPSKEAIRQKLINYVVKQLEPEVKRAAKGEQKAKPKKGESYALKDIGLEQGETKELYSKFNIQDAKELEALRKAFVAYIQQINIYEGRNITPETLLKTDDFWKMFFSEAGESFSATGRYQIRPWPPAVTIQAQHVQRARLAPQNQLDLEIAQRAANAAANEPVVIQFFNDAERPILFWRTEDKPGGIANELKEVRDQVVAAWKLDKARDKIVLKRAQEIAEKLQKSNTPMLTMSAELDKLKKDFDVKREIIPLGSRMEPVSPLVPVLSGGGQRVYKEFDLPAGLISYPRKDTAANLLGLFDLKKPIETGYTELDRINKALYDEIKRDKNPKGKFVQILTNQPRNAFYVAVVRDAPEPSHLDFNETVMQAFGHDQFFDRSQVDAGKKMRDDLMQQLRRAHKLDAPTEEVRKNFDHNEVN